MSKQYSRYKKIVHRMHEKTYGYENISRQPHCNDRWRQLRKLYGLNPQYYLAGEGQNTIWMNAFEEDEKHPRGLDCDQTLRDNRSSYWKRKGYDWMQIKHIFQKENLAEVKRLRRKENLWRFCFAKVILVGGIKHVVRLQN